MDDKEFRNAFLEAKVIALQEMVGLAARRRCMCCGWPLAGSEAHGCVQGNCAYRPNPRSSEYQKWKTRVELLIDARKEVQA